jgi:hypothetical protein
MFSEVVVKWFSAREGRDCLLVGTESGMREREREIYNGLVLVVCTSVIPVTTDLCSTSESHTGNVIVVCGA